jgi:hypothetical protein
MKSQFFSKPENLLLCMTFTMAFGFGVWQVLLNNFVVEKAQFTGVEIGILQSVREIPGFLAFTAVFVLLVLKEQTFVMFSLALTLAGVALTGFFPFEYGLYFTTLVMSIGFHYFETINKSLTLQWMHKDEAPHFLGRALSMKAVGSLVAYGGIWLAMGYFNVSYFWVYLVAGCSGVAFVIFLYFSFPRFNQDTVQKKGLVLKKQYWLYYALVFLSGARRQIFLVFAGFMMVEKFGFSVANISALFIVNYVFNFLFAAKIGKLIGRIGERRSLIIEYTGLICVFTGYAFVETAEWAAILYVVDHLFFALAIAVTTYFQKIAHKPDIAATTSVSFTINHIAAVVIPALLGMLWVVSNTAVFGFGVLFACLSLLCSFNVPAKPSESEPVIWGKAGKAAN